MTLKTVTALEAKALMAKGAKLIDIRGADEFAREHIAGAKSVPLEQLSAGGLNNHSANLLIFQCKSGNRTKMNASALRLSTTCEACILDGGIDSWKAAGLVVTKDVKRPIELNRQVQITAGGLVLTGFILGIMLHPGFHALSGAIGAGLVFSGVTGTCAMARLLKLMPWNRTVFA